MTALDDGSFEAEIVAGPRDPAVIRDLMNDPKRAMM